MAKMSATAAPIEGSGARKSTPATISADANLSESDIEVWNDVEWQPALHALEGWQPDGSYTGKSDPSPLAKLLRSGKPVPEAVAVTLGVLLDPPWGKKGPRLSLITAKRYSARTDLESVVEMLNLKKMIEEELKQSPNKLEAAIAEVMAKTKISRSKLMQAWSWNLEKTILKMSIYNPQPIWSPREPEKS